MKKKKDTMRAILKELVKGNGLAAFKVGNQLFYQERYEWCRDRAERLLKSKRTK